LQRILCDGLLVLLDTLQRYFAKLVCKRGGRSAARGRSSPCPLAPVAATDARPARRTRATSTTLARSLAESTAATSYHLRQLAHHGLIRELPERGNRRDRWWEAVAHSYGAKAPESDEARSAAYELAANVVEHDAQVVRAFLDKREAYPARWQDAALFTNASLWATPDELRSLSRQVHDLFAEYRRLDPDDRPEGAERIYVVLRAVPWAHELDERPRDRREDS
jgi:hypothetical protein